MARPRKLNPIEEAGAVARYYLGKENRLWKIAADYKISTATLIEIVKRYRGEHGIQRP